MTDRAPKTPLTRERALQIAAEVQVGKTSSYVAAAHHLSEYLLQEQRARSAAENELAYYKSSFFTRLTPDSLAVLPTPGSPTIGKRYRLIDVTRTRLIPELLDELEPPPAPLAPFTSVPDPFPSPPVGSTPLPPPAQRIPTLPAPPRVPGEHSFDLPTVYRTNRPPVPNDLRAMRSPVPELAPPTEEDLVSRPRLTVSDRPDPYTASEAPSSTRKATQPSMRSPIPHPADSTPTMIFDFSPGNTPALPCEVPPPGWYCTRNAGHEGPCAAHPSVPIYCGLCEHDHCVCPR